MSIDRAGKEEKKKKEDNLENFERLRDQLANAYSQAEIERIKARYELEKRLREDLYDMQEFGANRLQRQNLQFLRALAKAEQDRQDVAFSGQVSIAGAEGRVAASILPCQRQEEQLREDCRAPLVAGLTHLGRTEPTCLLH